VPEVSRGERILVVDDHEQLRSVIRRSLTSHGFQVDEAASLDQAYALGAAGYDAVLVDAHLGDERGTDLVETLIAQDPAAAGRCLVITGGAFGQLPDGVARLAKPFRIKQLLDAVELRTVPRPGAPGDAPAGPADGGALADPGPAGSGERRASEPAGDSETAANRPAGGAEPAASEPRAGWEAAPAASPWQPTEGESPPTAGDGLAWARQIRARERQQLVDLLHDGPVQELLAASLELQVLRRSVPPDAAERFGAALHQLEAVSRALRFLIDGTWPFLRPETDLAEALTERTAWLAATPVTVTVPGEPPGRGELDLALVVDVAELMLATLAPDGPAEDARIAVYPGPQGVLIEVACAAGPAGQAGRVAEAVSRLAPVAGARARPQLSDRRWQAIVELPSGGSPTR
jgi:CheY-like chemotaxis protein